ncbi:MAG: hypothetical protein ACKVOU_04415 [Cytophagales bacterium]
MRIILVSIFYFFFSSVCAKTDFTPRLAQSYTYLFKLKFDSAQILINKSLMLEPDNQVNTLMYCYVEFIRILLSEDFLIYAQWQNKFELRVNSIRKMAEASPYRRYILGEVYIQSSILKFKFGDQIGALVDFRKGYGYLADNEKQFPTFVYHKKSLGFIHILLSLIPNKYKWLINIAGFDTDLQKGTRQLQAAAESEIATKDEAYYLQIWLKVIFEDKEDECINAMRAFIGLHPDYVVAKWSLVMFLKSTNRVDEALLISNQIKPKSGFYYSPYFYFINGQMHLLVGEFEKCNAEMTHFLASYKGKMLRQSAFYCKYLADYSISKVENLNLYRDSVLLTPISGSEQDRIAQNSIRDNPKPTIEILKAKLYFDAGRYESCLFELDKIKAENISKTIEKVEYYYRKGRGFEKMNDKPQALLFYQLAIDVQKKQPYYFAPNAYLLMAKMLQNNDKVLAKSYLKEIDSYDKYEYQTEIEYQAKALLKKL